MVSKEKHGIKRSFSIVWITLEVLCPFPTTYPPSLFARIGADLNKRLIYLGAAYLFQKCDSTKLPTTVTVEWTQVQEFAADDRDTSDHLEASIVIENKNVEAVLQDMVQTWVPCVLSVQDV